MSGGGGGSRKEAIEVTVIAPAAQTEVERDLLRTFAREHGELP